MAEENAPQQQAPPLGAIGVRHQAQRRRSFGGPVDGRPRQGRAVLVAGPGGPKRGKRNFVRKKKVCRFCVDKVDYIDYKKAEILAPFIQDAARFFRAA